MNTLEFEELNFKAKYPAEWNELNKKTLLRVADLFCRGLERQDFLLMVFFALLPTRRFMAVNKNIYFRSGRFRWFPFFASRAISKGSKNLRPIAIDGFAHAKESVQFLIENINLTKQLMPSFKINGKRYYGPSDAIKNLTFGEYVSAEINMQLFQHDDNFDHLYALAAELYRPNVKGKRLLKESTESLEQRTALFKKSLSVSFVFAIYLFYVGCRIHLLNLYQDISGGETEDSEEPSNWTDVIFNLTNGSAKDMDIDAIMQTQLYNVFELFRHNKKEYEKAKARMNKTSGNKFHEFEKATA